MTEKQTPSQIISDEELAMVNSAAKRVVADDDPSRHVVPQYDFSRNPRKVAETTYPSAPKPSLEISERGKKIAKGAGIAVGVAAGTLAASQILGSMNGGNNSPDQGEPNPTIQAVVLDEEANLRNDPTVPHRDDVQNSLDNLNNQVTVQIEDDVRVLNGTDNGTWYGISTEDLATAIPDFNDHSDKDGVVWVNEAGASIIETPPEQVIPPKQPEGPVTPPPANELPLQPKDIDPNSMNPEIKLPATNDPSVNYDSSENN